MQAGLLPLFPLNVVLFPGADLPLHIFEDRYKEMMREIQRDRQEFGVVLANEKGIVNTGCSATIDQVLREYGDGRMDILTRGRRRFEIVTLNDERTFLRGEVDFFDDDEGAIAPAELRQRAIEGYNELQAMTASAPLPIIDTLDPRLSFRLAQPLPDLSFRQVLLNTRTEAGRLKQIADFIPGYLSRERRSLHVKRVAPQNGHGNGHAH
jgi:Lon protease-like protein